MYYIFASALKQVITKDSHIAFDYDYHAINSE